MIETDGILISEDILIEKFLCDLSRCKGICCVEGNSGAPLEPDEARTLAEEFAAYKPFMTADGIQAIEQQGFAVTDTDGDSVTPLVGDAECAYSYNKDGVTLCAIERAFNEGKTAFRKPVSCHLYPIRVARFGDGSLGLNYHRWAVCDGGACRTGDLPRLSTDTDPVIPPLYKMLREAIVRRFGEEFYEALEAAESALNPLS